jgi:hypothetical protein
MKQLAILILLTALFQIGYGQKSTKVNAEYFLFDKKGNKLTPALSYIGEFSNDGYAVFAQGGNYVENSYGKIPGAKYGILHESGKIIIPASYDYLETLYERDSLFIASSNDRYGLVDQRGNKITPIVYTTLTTLYDDNNVLKANLSANECILLDFTGKPLTKSFQDINSCTSGYYVTDKGYVGIIDKNYKELFPCSYEDITEWDGGIFHITNKYNKHYLVDSKGKKLTKEYDAIDYSYDDNYTTIGYSISLHGKQGFLSLDGKELISPTYNNLNQQSMGCNGFIFTYDGGNGKSGIINKEGKKVGKAQYSTINTISFFGKYLIVGFDKKKKTKKGSKKNSEEEMYEWGYDYELPETKYGLIDMDGKLVMKAEFSDYSGGYDGENLLILKKKDEWFAYNEALQPVFPKAFTHIEAINGLYKVQLGGVDNGYGTPDGGVFGIYDQNGREVIPVQYEDIEQIGYDNSTGYIIKSSGKYGLCSPSGQILLDPTYSEISCEDNMCIVSKYYEQSEQTKMGLYNTDGNKEVVPTQYDHIESLNYNSSYLFKTNNKFGLMSPTGKIILPAKYNFLKSTDLYDNEELVLANAYGEVTDSYYGSEVTGGNWGLINMAGDTILPFKFKEITFDSDSVVVLLDYDNKAYLFDLNQQKAITTNDINYISKLSYDWMNPMYLMGKDVTRGEYNETSGGTYGVINNKGEEIIPLSYSEITMEGDYFIANSLDFNGYDLVSNKGEVLLSRVTSIKKLNDSIFFIESGEEAYLYNGFQKKALFKGDYKDFLFPEYYYGYGAVYIGIKNNANLWGIMNKQSDVLIEPMYCDISESTSQGYLVVAQCGNAGEAYTYGVIDLLKNVMIPFEYESITSQYGETYECVKGGMVYTINLNNEILSKRKVTLEVENN